MHLNEHHSGFENAEVDKVSREVLSLFYTEKMLENDAIRAADAAEL